MPGREGRRSFHAEFGDVFSQPLGRIEFRQKLHRWYFQRLTEIEHLEVAYPDELTLKLLYPRPIDFPADNLKPRCKLVLLETEIVAPLSHLRPNYILVHCAHGSTSRSV